MKNQSSNLGYFLGQKHFVVVNLICFLDFAKPLYQNVCIDQRIFFTFCKKSEKHCKLPVGSWAWGFSLILNFSVYFNY